VRAADSSPIYYSLGDYDGVIRRGHISEAPDETAIAVSLVAAVSADHLKTIKTTTLLLPKRVWRCCAGRAR
jgi:hypothetical protein